MVLDTVPEVLETIPEDDVDAQVGPQMPKAKKRKVRLLRLPFHLCFSIAEKAFDLSSLGKFYKEIRLSQALVFSLGPWPYFTK